MNQNPEQIARDHIDAKGKHTHVQGHWLVFITDIYLHLAQSNSQGSPVLF